MRPTPTSAAASVVRAALYGTFVTWAAVSSMRQFTRQSPVILTRVDPYGLVVPNYHFFCPEPAQHDLNLLYRDKLAAGGTGPWQEVVLTERRRLRHMLFYPQRRIDKGLMDLAKEVTHFARIADDVNRVSLTRGYMSILNLVTYGVSHDQQAVQTQYAFAHSAAYEPEVEPYVAFVSGFHDLPPRESAGRIVPVGAAA